MNQLTKIDEFKAALQDYQLSKTALHALSQTKLVLLVAPTSSGRNTVIRYLMDTGDYYFIVSDNTRLPRINDGIPEQNGREYWFRSEDEVLADIKAGKYLEAAVIHNQQVCGISVRELELATTKEKIAITDAEISGAENVMRLKPDALALFVLPPSFDEWQRRIVHRGEMHPEEYKRRMQSAVVELQAAIEHDYFKFVINDTIDSAAQTITQLVKFDNIDKAYQAEARNLAEQLLLSTAALVASLE